MGTPGDAHPHVLVCSMNRNKTYHASQEEKDQGRVVYRTQQLKAVLASHDKQVQEAALDELAKDLSDLGIHPASLMTAV